MVPVDSSTGAKAARGAHEREGSAFCRTARTRSAHTRPPSAGTRRRRAAARKAWSRRRSSGTGCRRRRPAARRTARAPRQPIASSAAAASAVPARRNSIGSMLLSAAYLSRNATPKNSTMIPTRTTVLPPSSQSRARGRRARRGRLAVWAAREAPTVRGRGGVSLARIAAAGVGAGEAARTGSRCRYGRRCIRVRRPVGQARGGRTAEGGTVRMGWRRRCRRACARSRQLWPCRPSHQPAGRAATPLRASASRPSPRGARRARPGEQAAGRAVPASRTRRAPCRCSALALLQRVVEAEPDRGAEHCAGDGGEIPIHAAIPPTMKPIAVKPSSSRLAPSLVSLSACDRMCARRGGVGMAGRRTGAADHGGRVAACVAISVLAGMYHSGCRGFSGLARYRGVYRPVAARLLHGHAFIGEARRFRLSRSARDRT